MKRIFLLSLFLILTGVPMSEAAETNTVSHPVIRMTTSKGAFDIELYPEYAPKHVERILILVEKKFYNGIRFHRIVPNFVAQAGDPATKKGLDQRNIGSGGSDLPDIPLEVTPKITHQRGMVGMARASDPDSANSQFYIALKDIHQLDMQYTVFGRVLNDGVKVVDQLKVGDQIIDVKKLD
ncbi:MAG: peptidylprolyl isomerase [Verrucomicrobiae bacterium]|nr:peptidylprolyl isomerase [Verrucomicrobiae bacterium]